MKLRVAAATVLVALLSLAIPARVCAHPMGNFSINHYAKIVVGARQIELDYIIDMAEIPTFQEIQQNGIAARNDDPSLAAYLAKQSERLKGGLTLDVSGRPLALQTVSGHAIFPPGAGGLPTLKIGFVYRAGLSNAIGAAALALRYRDRNFSDRAGWKEIVALAGPDTRLVTSSVPAQDRSLELTNYPTDVLHSPPQVLGAEVTFKGLVAGMLASDKAAPEAASAGWLATGSAASTSGARLEANRQGTPRNAFTDLIKSNRADLAFLLMAALVAAVLGGFHALEPGHGKTLVAAYLVGSHGEARHAVLLGAVVTASHTVSVYTLGIITLYASRWLLPEQLYPWLGIASGSIVAALGFTLFVRGYLSIDRHSHCGDEHDHAHHHHASHGRDHYHEQPLAPSHGYPHTHEHAVDPGSDAISLNGLFALGVTGGIVPCPAALVVLLGALAFHRIAFGLFLIVAFSAGLAAVLISFGLAMVYAGRFMSSFAPQAPLTERWLPLASYAVIAVVGVAITLQSMITAGVFRV